MQRFDTADPYANNLTTLAKRPRYANNLTTLAKRPRYANNYSTKLFNSFHD
ncbi:MAG: hypothetical protein F6K50_24125 [Moorea sp. SIO3I7]|uniref:hypothetical protein n=1 Tax=Moorena sp. SIO3I8 TaxID=2607833 RepID=UPI0013C04A31|nr:hypothetical protein [Moorena sp. SIO3I8]NEN98485.1 hypothetical protein [Moorena sp. SIO3I7]NEO06149.1 hypothetical protein [Moorena sp. SIO3I8]